MSRVLSALLLLGVFGGIGGYVYNMLDTQVKEGDFRLTLAQARADFVQEHRGALHIADAKVYEKEIDRLLRDYFSKVNAIRTKHPKMGDPESKGRSIAADHASGAIDDLKKSFYDEYYGTVLAVHTAMLQMDYKPIVTSAKDGVRLDIIDAERTKVDGEDRVKLTFVLWGGYGDVGYDQLFVRLMPDTPVEPNKKETSKRQMSAEGGAARPNILVNDPVRWVETFPPGAVVGYYDLPLVPSDVTELLMAFTYTLRSKAGNLATVKVELPALPVEDGWKLPEGQVWDAVVMTETEQPAEEPAK